MNLNRSEMEPLEQWLEKKSAIANQFPSNKSDYFHRYWSIKTHLANHIYPYVGAGTSAEDQGIYTDHSIDHFNTVIRYAGRLLGLKCNTDNSLEIQDIHLSPYEVFIMLVSILLHDAGNIEGRRNHEKKPFKIFIGLGAGLCPDKFEAQPIAIIAEAHGGKITNTNGLDEKDTIEGLRLKETDTYGGIVFRPKAIAALVRFSDEICEDHTRAARFLLITNQLPKKSEVFHHYANSIKSVVVDLRDKSVTLEFKLEAKNLSRKFGKDNGNNECIERYLIDEINERLEKMLCELLYCRKYMYELSQISRIKANIEIWDDTGDYLRQIKEERFILTEMGYPQRPFLFREQHPDWSGEKINMKIEDEVHE